jgi:STE24 endopeptidase
MKNILGIIVGLLLLSVCVQADSLTTKSGDSAMIGPTDSAAVDTHAVTAATVAAPTNPESTPESLRYPLSPERQQMRNSYARFGNIWRFVDFFSGILIFCIILFTGLSAKLRDWARGARQKFLVLWLYLALFLIVDYLLTFPFDYYRNFVVESNYGFMNETFGGWLGEGMKSLAISIVFGILPAFFLYFVIERFKRWWLVFSVGAIPVMIFFIVIAPVVISPMFNKFEPLKDKQLETELLTLADKAGIQGSHVFEVDASKQSSKVNAYVTGLFNTKRIVLYDNLIKGFTHDEIRFVMGHEMGHYVLNHIWVGLGIAWVFLLFLLWVADKTIHGIIHRFRGRFKFERLEDIASLPLIMLCLSIMAFVMQPINNTASRAMEHRADRFGMDVTGVSGEVAATAFDKLSAYNLSDPNPSPLIEFWFYDHPALQKRMEFVRSYKP